MIDEHYEAWWDWSTLTIVIRLVKLYEFWSALWSLTDFMQLDHFTVALCSSTSYFVCWAVRHSRMWCPHDIGRDSWVWGEQGTLEMMNSPHEVGDESLDGSEPIVERKRGGLWGCCCLQSRSWFKPRLKLWTVNTFNHFLHRGHHAATWNFHHWPITSRRAIVAQHVASRPIYATISHMIRRKLVCDRISVKLLVLLNISRKAQA